MFLITCNFLSFEQVQIQCKIQLHVTIRKLKVIIVTNHISINLKYDVRTDVLLVCVNKAVKTNREVKDTITLSLKS